MRSADIRELTTQMANLERPHGCIGASMAVGVLVLCGIAASLPNAIRVIRYTGGVPLDCATGKTEVPPVQAKVVYIVAPEKCWTDWIEPPKSHYVTCDGQISEELFFADGTTQVFQNWPGKQWPALPHWTGLRFKNDSETPVRITIQFTN
jgi:hypothetical protein